RTHGPGRPPGRLDLDAAAAYRINYRLVARKPARVCDSRTGRGYDIPNRSGLPIGPANHRGGKNPAPIFNVVPFVFGEKVPRNTTPPA
ncbi:MAG TPA: hypothetical protein VKD71_05335, partial [Gemmataceae bacterium]|nr:hypothetical protein [Gemmataceae bacterium]